MENAPRGSDGRRLFSPGFRRELFARLVRDGVTISEPGREPGFSRGVLQRWRPLIARGVEAAAAGNEDVVRASELKAAQQHIRELERLLGKQEVELEILRAARDEAGKGPGFDGVSKQ